VVFAGRITVAALGGGPGGEREQHRRGEECPQMVRPTAGTMIRNSSIRRANWSG
jgi:hypothetical protein